MTSFKLKGLMFGTDSGQFLALDVSNIYQECCFPSTKAKITKHWHAMLRC